MDGEGSGNFMGILLELRLSGPFFLGAAPIPSVFPKNPSDPGAIPVAFIPKNQRGLLESASLWKFSPIFPDPAAFSLISPRSGGIPADPETSVLFWKSSKLGKFHPKVAFSQLMEKHGENMLGNLSTEPWNSPSGTVFFGDFIPIPCAGREPDLCSSFPRRNGAGKGFWGVLG